MEVRRPKLRYGITIYAKRVGQETYPLTKGQCQTIMLNTINDLDPFISIDLQYKRKSSGLFLKILEHFWPIFHGGKINHSTIYLRNSWLFVTGKLDSKP